MFKKENFNYDGMYLTYNLPGQHYGNNEFVARFKYVKFAGAFKNFLIKNFTTDEYFGRYKAGESPLDILESKGFVTPQAKKLCKKHNMVPSKENYMKCIRIEMQQRGL
tara:strand:- start:16275 stop:16598 length:324 start_codon:yes stop_codon:yes gene_type:complete